MNNNGPTTNPWRTSLDTFAHPDVKQFIVSRCFLSEKKFSIYFSIFPTTFTVFNFSNKRLCRTILNAFCNYKHIVSTDKPLLHDREAITNQQIPFGAIRHILFFLWIRTCSQKICVTMMTIWFLFQSVHIRLE